MLTFITGGARSGKSRFALKRTEEIPWKKAFLATALPSDEEMKERIRRHQEERAGHWHTLEEPYHIASALNLLSKDYSCILLDCLTLWTSNLIFKDEAFMQKEIQKFLLTIPLFKEKNKGKSNLLIVSNEVGMGIVPDNPLSRKFRDKAGFLNQRVAELADEVFVVFSGIPLKIKAC